MSLSQNWVAQLRQFVKTWRDAREASETEKYLGDRPFPHFALTESATSWDDFVRWQSTLSDSWCFRGQGDAKWSLDTSLDRAVRVHYEHEHGSGYEHLDREAELRDLLSRFQQQAPSHLHHVPAIDDVGSWLALMQHHGVPTKLLDWTMSSYAALYFALEEVREGPSAVWAIDLSWLDARALEILGVSPTDHMTDLLGDPQKAMIVRITPAMVSDRMRAQQGLLLSKLHDHATFSQMLMSMIIHPSVPDQPVLRKLVIARGLRVELLERLYELNVHAASLFPGADGIGRALRHSLEMRVDQQRRRITAEADAFFVLK